MPLAAICPRCGGPNPQGHRYCPPCGESLDAASGSDRPQGGIVRARKVPRSGAPAVRDSASPTGTPAPTGPPPAGPGATQIRHLNAVSLFAETLRAWGRDLLAYLGLFVAYGLASAGITLATTWVVLGVPSLTTAPLLSSLGLGSSAPNLAVILALLAVPVVGALLQTVLTAAVTYAAICRRRGARVPWPAAFREGIRRYRSVLVGTLLLTLLAYGLVFLAVPLVGGTGQPPGPDLLWAECGLFLYVFVFLFLWVALGLYAAAVMMEGVGAVASLRRSWSLTRGYRLSIFGAEFLIGIILAVVGFATSLPTGLSGIPIAAAAITLGTDAVTGSWLILLAAMAYELIGEERRAQSYEWGAMAFVPRAALPEKAPAYEQPGAPPCPICGTPLLWVPAYGRWYCARCKAYR